MNALNPHSKLISNWFVIRLHNIGRKLLMSVFVLKESSKSLMCNHKRSVQTILFSKHYELYMGLKYQNESTKKELKIFCYSNKKEFNGVFKNYNAKI